jgi:dTDP-4-amino-4,6-dideoxygalactose transaminase
MAEPAQIPFNRPGLTGREFDYMADAAKGGRLSGDGAYTARCHALLERELGAAKALLTTSCTHALEMAALLLDVKAGDEVVFPSYTFVSVANAFVLRGARPVFADIRPDTLNLDESQLERLITPRTRAIVPVHYAGVGSEMDAIMAIARQHGVAVVEDNAHGLFGRYRSRPLGTIAPLATLSFHETKNITCGEGGALLINDRTLIERAEIIREKGTNRSRFFRGQVDKYSWVDVGSSYLPSELLAAFLFAQLEARERVQAARSRIWRFYAEHLADWAGRQGIGLPRVPDHCDQPFHLFFMLLPSLGERQHLIAHLKESGIGSAFHYLPLHLSDMGRRFGGKPGDCPVTEDISDRLLRLPFYSELTNEDLARVVHTLQEWRP